MAAVVTAIAHVPGQRKKHLLAGQCLLIICLGLVFFNGNNDSTGFLRGRREEYAIILSFFTYYCFFVAIQACFHLIGVINGLSVDNDI